MLRTRPAPGLLFGGDSVLCGAVENPLQGALKIAGLRPLILNVHDLEMAAAQVFQVAGVRQGVLFVGRDFAADLLGNLMAASTAVS